MMKTEEGILDGGLFNFLVNMEIARAIRYQNYTTLLFIEPDQQVEDRTKFDAFTRILKEEVRTTDVVGVVNENRCGVILHNTDLKNALVPCKRIRDRMKNYNFTPDDGHITISIGVSCCPTDSNDFTSLTSMAITMLSLAKKQGGDRISYPNEKEVL